MKTDILLNKKHGPISCFRNDVHCRMSALTFLGIGEQTMPKLAQELKRNLLCSCRLLMEGSKAHGAGYYCLHFAHCHNGHHIGDLRVYDKIGNGERHTWWSLAGDFGPKWYTAAVQLDLTGVTEVGVFDARYVTRMPSGKART